MTNLQKEIEKDGTDDNRTGKAGISHVFPGEMPIKIPIVSRQPLTMTG